MNRRKAEETYLLIKGNIADQNLSQTRRNVQHLAGSADFDPLGTLWQKHTPTQKHGY